MATYNDIAKVNSEIKTTDIKGKGYAEVPMRVDAFRKLYPEGTIETELISNNNGVCVFKAVAKNGDTILGTGHAYEKEGSSFINKTSFIENCETSAVGRALGFVGLGIETSIASYEEVATAKKNQDNDPPQTVRAEDKGDEEERNKLIQQITECAETKEISLSEVFKTAGVKGFDDLSLERLNKCMNWIAKK